MHPEPLFRSHDHARFHALIEEVGFGMVFAATPAGPQVVHTPFVWADGVLQFHMSRRNAMAGALDGAQVLAVVNGPDGYVSPRFYDDRDTVPTWDYVALEMAGRVVRMDDAGLETFFQHLIARQEGRLGGSPWRAAEAGGALWANLVKGIIGYRMEVEEWRSTFKLSQENSSAERERIADGHRTQGNPHLAQAMERFAA
ncbi:FMN-binding negative transcriptional regulator [Erythrobacter arachoides]|uniref:FMN-binding negative transcriptional regulator n=1 Tax=Aurantiacibacter arachoides TaxID=1850444 RepID=A0A845A481_9SPHN|nr:FMN-binding negative transcriptional regulator [Aurantiacibacter arachoides]MXO92399.1 FMN-binding negative transcriptional regulator [Aurantiacibacter arachoides]GGD57470.1 hypothetical protein GCM10011411_16900 [Aurantiacibacter arachoides]